MLLLGLMITTACDLSSRREQCEADRRAAVVSWQEVEGYFTRMSTLQERDLERAQAQAEYSTRRREAALATAENHRYKQRTGLVDLRTGEERVSPDAAQANADKARSASARAAVLSDPEEADIAAAMYAEETLAALQGAAAQAAAIGELVKGDPWAAWEIAEAAPELDATELGPRARDATRAYLDRCVAR